MPLVPALRRHPLRWIVLLLIALLLIALIAGVVIVRSLLQPQRFTALLQDQFAGTGLVLSVDAPATPTLWPHPAVQLQGFRLSNVGASTPLLEASEARIVVPWHALLRRELAIQRLEIDTPRIDLDQLQALLARLPHTAGAPHLPRISAGIRIRNGTLLGNDAPLLFGIDLDTGPLLPRTQFRLDASANDSTGRGGAFSLRAVPERSGDALHFGRIGIGVSIENGARASLSGDALWRGGANLGATLRGALTTPAPTASAPATTAPSAASTAPASTSPPATVSSFTLDLGVQPAQGARPLVLAVKLDGGNNHIDARVAPTALADWWQQLVDAAPGTALTLPPLTGYAQLDNLDFGPLHAQGMRIDAGPDVVPLDAAPAPAATSAQPPQR